MPYRFGTCRARRSKASGSCGSSRLELKKYLVKFYYSSLPIGRTVGQVRRKVYNFGGDVVKVLPDLTIGFVADPCIKIIGFMAEGQP